MNVKPKILAVDDSPSNLIALEAVFSGEPFELIEAKSGFEALEYLQKNKDNIAVILLDVQMPEMDGFETARRIKRIEGCAEIPIIFITAVFREDPFILKGYSVGAIDYFSKPFDPDILRTKVGIYAAHQQKSYLLREREKRITETEELLKTGRKLSSILETLPVGVMIADVDGEVFQTNEEVSHILCTDLSAPNDQYGSVMGWWDAEGKMIKQKGGPLERAIVRGQSSHNEIIYIKCLDGTSKTILASATPLRALDGHIVGAGVVIQDITKSKEIEKDLEGKIMNLISLGVELEYRGSTP